MSLLKSLGVGHAAALWIAANAEELYEPCKSDRVDPAVPCCIGVQAVAPGVTHVPIGPRPALPHLNI